MPHLTKPLTDVENGLRRARLQDCRGDHVIVENVLVHARACYFLSQGSSIKSLAGEDFLAGAPGDTCLSRVSLARMARFGV